jgi:CRP/FNR family transcriptional regulator, cyclic AMP receptor protein
MITAGGRPTTGLGSVTEGEQAPSRRGGAAMLDLLTERERSRVLRTGVRRRFQPHEIVFHEGDPGDSLHIVTDGAFIARGSYTLGELIAVNVLGVGDVFGEMVLLTPGARRSATVISHGRASTLMVGQGDFEALMDEGGNLDRVLLSLLAGRNRVVTAHLVELLFAPVEQRVCMRLLEFSQKVVRTSDQGWVNLSQAELATLAGTTRSTVNRVLGRARELGLVEVARGRIRVADEPRLRQSAQRALRR